MKNLLKIVLGSLCLVLISSSAVWAEDDEHTKEMKEQCEKGESRPCYLLGQRYRTVELDNKTALLYYIKSCDNDDMDGCNIAGILTQQQGLQYSKHWKEAAKFYQKACDAKQDLACANMGSLKYREGRAKSALKYYKLACDLGNVVGCQNVTRLSD